jgi:hypothetical protein
MRPGCQAGRIRAGCEGCQAKWLKGASARISTCVESRPLRHGHPHNRVLVLCVQPAPQASASCAPPRAPAVQPPSQTGARMQPHPMPPHSLGLSAIHAPPLNTQPPCPLQAVPMDSLMDAFLATHGSPPSASFSLPSLPFRHRFLLLPDDDPGMHPTQHRLPYELCLGKSTLGYVASKHP